MTNLLPAATNEMPAMPSRARVLVVACDSKFFGVRFRELSFSVFVHRPDASEGSDAAFLVQAFNSSRFFAWSERTWFSTPYRHGMIDVDVGLPAATRLGLEGQTVFSAVMKNGSRVGPASLRRAGPPERNVIEDGGPALEASLYTLRAGMGRSFCREAHAGRPRWDDCSSPRWKGSRKPIRSLPRTR